MINHQIVSVGSLLVSVDVFLYVKLGDRYEKVFLMSIGMENEKTNLGDDITYCGNIWEYGTMAELCEPLYEDSYEDTKLHGITYDYAVKIYKKLTSEYLSRGLLV